jgi:anti-sigma factor RsiW
MLDYTEQTLDGQTRQQVAHHLQTCPACSRELEAMRATLDLLSATPMFEEPPEAFWEDFTRNVMRKVRAADPPTIPFPALFSGWQARVVLAAALLAIALAGVAGYRLWHPQPSALISHVDPDNDDGRSAWEEAVQRIVSEAVPQEMLRTEFGLFDDIASPALEMYSSDAAIDGWLSGLSAEEKRMLLFELLNMREPPSP